jgi:hypothetical protein
MKRLLPHLFWASGLVLVVIGTAIGPGIPAQDYAPGQLYSPADLARIDKQLIFTDIGAIFLGFGIIWILVRRLTHRFSRRSVSHEPVA